MTPAPTLVVTDDLYLRTLGIAHPLDNEVIGRVPECRIVSSAEALALIEQEAIAIPADFVAALRQAASRKGPPPFVTINAMQFMTEERALVVRTLRCSSRYSWRALAAECFARWGNCSWAPPGNQIIGMGLCECAAGLLGEDAHAPPWNDV